MNANIIEALSKLDVTNDNHWTEQGLPRIETVKFLTGDTSITRDAINAAIPGFNRNNVSLTLVEAQVVETQDTSVIIKDAEIEPTLQDQFEAQQEYLEILIQQQSELNKEILEQTYKVHGLATEIQKVSVEKTSQEAIQSYLQSQQGVLQERGARIRMIADSGIKLKELAEGLKSPLDAALSRKKA